jgi:hypothetical protein
VATYNIKTKVRYETLVTVEADDESDALSKAAEAVMKGLPDSVDEIDISPLWDEAKYGTPWIRYRFYVEGDYRPVVFNTAFPYWCTGDDSQGRSVVVAYLPRSERLAKYWDNAEEVSAQDAAKIEFTDRFPRPRWYVEA